MGDERGNSNIREPRQKIKDLGRSNEKYYFL